MARASIEPVASFADAAQDWDALATRSENPFLTRDWAEAWWTAYGDGRALALHRVREDDRVVAILPLYRRTLGPVPALRLIGHGPADELGPVCAPQDLPLALRALDAVRRELLPPHGVVLADRLPGGALEAAGLPPLDLRPEPSPLVDIDGTWDAWLAGKSSNFRGRVRRLERKLVREHGLTFRRTERPEEVADDLDTVIRLHEERWAADGVPTGAFAGPRRAFHHDLAARALHSGSLRLWVAEVDEYPIAAYYGFRVGGSEWYYQLGRDPAWNRSSIGFVLLSRVLRDAFEAQMTSFRFGLGGEDYKDRFADRDPGLHTTVIGAGIVGSVTLATAWGLRRLPERLRAPLLSRAG